LDRPCFTMFFLSYLMIRYTICTILHKFIFINIHQFFTISHSIISHSLFLFSSTMCFYHWTFIQEGYSRFLGIECMGKRHGGTMQICTICLGVKLTYLDVWLTIKVYFALERKKKLTPASFPLHLLLFPPFPLHLLVPHV
jgi:hypothetical protein